MISTRLCTLVALCVACPALGGDAPKKGAKAQSQPAVVGPPAAAKSADAAAKPLDPAAKPADGGPSLQETVDWLKSKLDGYTVSFQTSYTPEHSGIDYCYTTRAERIPCTACRGDCVTTPDVDETTWSKEERRYKYVAPAANLPEPRICNFQLDSVTKTSSPETGVDSVDGFVFITAMDAVPETPKRHEDWLRAKGFNMKVRPDVYYLEGAGGLYFTDHELATRVAKAIARLAKLCGAAQGQKAEPF
jgi:hypothetical protein